MARFIFITGGVVSSLGKGLASAALGALLQARGFSVRLRKLDPYLNVDPGTMSPFEHGEVFVTDDGAETDLDLGHYERFTGVAARKTDSVSSGRIYSNVLEKERRGVATEQQLPELVSDFIELSKQYVRERTVEPAKALGRLGGFGMAAAFLFVIAALFLGIAVMRTIVWALPDGAIWSGFGYILSAIALLAATGLVMWRAAK